MTHGILPLTAVYALRVMAALAMVPGAEGTTADDLARATQIPRAYVAKILRKLVVAELVSSKRGNGGGFALARPAKKIPYSDILRAVDAQVDRDACVFGWGACSAQNACPLHPSWASLKKSFLDWCDRSTLADVDIAGFARLAVAGLPPTTSAATKRATPRGRKPRSALRQVRG